MTEFVLGIDIGGTKTAAGLVTAAGKVVARVDAPTPSSEGGERILDMAVRLGRELIDRHPGGARDIIAVGVGSAGVIDPIHRRVIAATDDLSSWAGTEIGSVLASAFGLPVVTQNDVHAHAVGEAFVGAGRGHRTVVVAAVGTGIGGAVVLDGVPQAGARGVAGHLGHIPIDEAAGLQCPCGKTGHVEAVSSGTALYRLYLRRGGDPTARDSRDVVARALTDPIAHDAVVTSATALGRALGGVVNLIDPGVVIIAGGMLNAGKLWWASMDGGLRQTVLPILNDVSVVRAQLGDDAAIIGAAKRAFDTEERPT
jgi:glucokinase